MQWSQVADVDATQSAFQNAQSVLELQDEQHLEEWGKKWTQILEEGRAKPEERRQNRLKGLADFSEYEAKVASGGVDLNSWRQMLIPTLTVHLQGMDRRGLNPGYETSAHAMQHVLVMIPVAPTLLPGGWDITDLIFLLGARVTEAYMSSQRGLEVAEMGRLEHRHAHHKRFEYELGGVRFVIAACAADRPAQVLHFSPTEAGRNPFEMMHMYNAMGLSRQHHLQQVILVRIRDFALAAVVVDTVQQILGGGARVMVRGSNKDPKDNVGDVLKKYTMTFV